MQFAASETLATLSPQARSLFEKVDAFLAVLDSSATIIPRQWASSLGVKLGSITTILDQYVEQGLLRATDGVECDCGNVRNATEVRCTCGRAPNESAVARFFEFAPEEKTRVEARVAERRRAASRLPVLAAPPLATIGVITALPHEHAAMEAMLDDLTEYWGKIRDVRQRYVCGRIPSADGATHQVVLTLLPDVANNQAAARATVMLTSIPTLRTIIMCGIAGGVPRPGVTQDDVRLGDIVFTSVGGVIQYDFGKDQPGTWALTSRPRAPSVQLLEVCRNILAGELSGRRPWEAHFGRAANIRGSQRPPDDSDAKGMPLNLPSDVNRRAGWPRLFDGTIASANRVLKDPAVRDRLREQHGVKAVEMETSGIADATWTAGEGYMAIRGICDYCDPAKGDDWQVYAAIVAAAFTRAMLESMPA